MTEQEQQRRAFWVDPAHDPRNTDEPPVDESATLRQYLDHYRMTFEMKCEDLIRQEGLPPLYREEERPDFDFDGAVGTDECAAQAWESWRREVAHAREVHVRYADPGEPFIPGELRKVRGVVVHMIEEYARHCGHADLVRECIDGRTGQ